MATKTILALWHSGSKGKTQTLRELAILLLKNYPTFSPIYPITSSISSSDIHDFRLVVKINGIIIGIETQGDPNTNLKGRLLDLVNTYNCDIILCTSRTRGETVAAVEHIHNTFGYQTVWTSTYQVENRFQDTLVNQLKAKHLLDLLQSLKLI